MNIGLGERRKNVRCAVCNNRIMRAKTFEQWLGLSNRTVRGQKTEEEILAECEEDFLLWKARPERCLRHHKPWLEERRKPVTYEVALHESSFTYPPCRLSSAVAPGTMGSDVAVQAGVRLGEADRWDLLVRLTNVDAGETTYWQLVPDGYSYKAREILP